LGDHELLVGGELPQPQVRGAAEEALLVPKLEKPRRTDRFDAADQVQVVDFARRRTMPVILQCA
jgi:hypothetical protein